MMPDTIRARLIELREEFQQRARKTAPGAWSSMEPAARTVLLLMAGIDGDDLASLALRDWREFSREERGAIVCAADALRDQLNRARSLSWAW